MVAIVGAIVVAALTGCTLGQARTFAGRAEDACAKASRSISTLDRRTTEVDAVAYVIDRYAILERLVAEIAGDTAFPGGDRGRRLRRIWIDPARASLRAGRDAMTVLRRAVAVHAPTDATVFASAAAAGTSGVDTAALTGAGFARCAAAFTAGPATSTGAAG